MAIHVGDALMTGDPVVMTPVWTKLRDQLGFGNWTDMKDGWGFCGMHHKYCVDGHVGVDINVHCAAIPAVTGAPVQEL